MPATKTTLRSLDELSQKDRAFAGSKGALLGELTNAGLPVPGGFVVEAGEYREFLESSGLREKIGERLDRLDVNDPRELVSASVHIRSELSAAAVPDGIAQRIVLAYQSLGSARVAVRPSITEENTANRSYAGANESQLRVGADAVLDSVKHCWSSLFTSQHIYFCAKHGGSALTSDIAVVIQHHVEAQKAGTMLTVDPVTGMSDRYTIEAVLGLGEAVSGGSVLPDRFVVDKLSGSMLTSQVRHKEMVVETMPGAGTVTRELPEDSQGDPVLNELEIRLLTDIGNQVEALLGDPQSLEWAIDFAGVTWILQTRPALLVPPPGQPANGITPGLIKGESAMAGVVSGRVRVVTSIDDAVQFKPDEILVTRDLAAEWTPLMQRASAVVTDRGGVTSHAATVARELRVPCVVGTEAATDRLETGEYVLVDATNGYVELK